MSQTISPEMSYKQICTGKFPGYFLSQEGSEASVQTSVSCKSFPRMSTAHTLCMHMLSRWQLSLSDITGAYKQLGITRAIQVMTVTGRTRMSWKPWKETRMKRHWGKVERNWFSRGNIFCIWIFLVIRTSDRVEGDVTTNYKLRISD